MATVSPAEVQKNLAGVEYPASKEELIQVAQREGASEEVLGALENIEDREYQSPTDVMEEFGSAL